MYKTLTAAEWAKQAPRPPVYLGSYETLTPAEWQKQAPRGPVYLGDSTDLLASVQNDLSGANSGLLLAGGILLAVAALWWVNSTVKGVGRSFKRRRSASRRKRERVEMLKRELAEARSS